MPINKGDKVDKLGSQVLQTEGQRAKLWAKQLLALGKRERIVNKITKKTFNI